MTTQTENKIRIRKVAVMSVTTAVDAAGIRERYVHRAEPAAVLTDLRVAYERKREWQRCNGQRQGKGRSGLQVVLHQFGTTIW